MTLLEYLALEAAVVSDVAAQHCEILEAVLDERWGDADAPSKVTYEINCPLPGKRWSTLAVTQR